MKIAPRNIATTLKQPAKNILAWLCYGADQGKVLDYGASLCESLRDGDQDPLNFVSFAAKDLKDDAGLFFTETAAVSMFGGNKVIRIYDAKDSYAIAQLVEDYLKQPQPVGLVIEAGGLETSSKLRKLFEKEANLGVIACYHDEKQDLSAMVNTILKEHQCTIARDAHMALLARLGSDRAISRMEVEKLCLYKGSGEITIQDMEELLEDTSLASIQAVISSSLLGQFDLLEKNLSRLWLENIAPIAVLRSISRQLLRLQEAKAHVSQGIDKKSALKKLSPPVFFKEESAFLEQMERWSEVKIYHALERINQAEIQSMDNARVAEVFVHRALLGLASAARKR